MSRLSYHLSRAAASGRAQPRPESREQILARLLMKRAAAYRAGLQELEAKLRDQIAWSLPVRRGESAESPVCGESRTWPEK